MQTDAIIHMRATLTGLRAVLRSRGLDPERVREYRRARAKLFEALAAVRDCERVAGRRDK